MNSNILYHQMLVLSHIGGARKLAIEVHRFCVATRGRVSRLRIPDGLNAEQVAGSLANRPQMEATS